MKNKLQFEPLAIQVFEAIESQGGKVFLVGGIVRDVLMEREITYHDVDVEVYHLPLVKLQEILSAFGKVNTVGKSFGILKVSTLPNYDFALPRTETKTGQGHRDFSVVVDAGLQPKDAAIRRDITINAMLYEYSTDKIYDFYGGQEDIKKGILRMIDRRRFMEDPLRVLRVAQFAARFQYTIDSETRACCKQMVKDRMLEEISLDRVYQEYCKLLLSNKPSIGLYFLSEIEALPTYLEALKHTQQRRDFHPEGDVFTHTLLVVDLAALVKQRSSQPLSFMWSCLLHDIGKPLVTTNNGSAPKHNEAGVSVFKKECYTLIRSKKMQKYIQTMIMYHMHLMNMARRDAPDVSYYRVLKGIDGVFPIEDLILLSKCDKLGRYRNGHQEINGLDAYIKEKVERLGTKALVPLVNGETLLSLGFKQSNQFSKLLEEAYELQIQGMEKADIIKHIRKI